MLGLLGAVVRFSCGGSHRAYSFNDYMLAGLFWMRGENLNSNRPGIEALLAGRTSTQIFMLSYLTSNQTRLINYG
jgi:hypothetical protein